jgi:CheY-like chemotaxis protein
LVIAMGGRIWVDSLPGCGAQFHFTVPLQTGNHLQPQGGRAGDGLRQVRALIVDDNGTNRRILEALLRRWELKPTAVAGGEEALAELASASGGDPYTLVLTDRHMPGMDGFGLCQRIRHRPELSQTAIVMLTSARHQEDAEHCRRIGIRACLLKPIRQSELRQAILRLLSENQQRNPKDSPASAAPGPEAQQRKLRVLLAEDNTVNQRLASRLLEKKGYHVEVAGNGCAALRALERENYDVVLMDVQMPEMDGMEATATIREKERRTGRHQVVIALTAHAVKDDLERCLAAGMDDYLVKPIRPRDLYELLARYEPSHPSARV